LDLLGLLLREVTNFAEGGKVVMSHFEEVRTRLPDLSNIRNERRVFGRSSVCRFESFCKRVKGYANSLSRVICADNLGPGSHFIEGHETLLPIRDYHSRDFVFTVGADAF
jgi:hypothetical protein